ncbi:MAG: YdeI/OmpD-associated family protein [Chloroflexi bacterium]|nr:YdeI/OmpD-associated family protein [Chloroflexota bacterium]
MTTRQELAVPAELAARLKSDVNALAIFEAMLPSCQPRYVNWINEAKKEEAKRRRIDRTLEMILD